MLDGSLSSQITAIVLALAGDREAVRVLARNSLHVVGAATTGGSDLGGINRINYAPK